MMSGSGQFIPWIGTGNLEIGWVQMYTTFDDKAAAVTAA